MGARTVKGARRASPASGRAPKKRKAAPAKVAARQGRRRRGAATPGEQLWEEQAITVPRADVPHGNAARLRRVAARSAFWLNAVVGPLALVGILLMAGNYVGAVNRFEELGETVAQEVSAAPGQGQARAALQEYLDTDAVGAFPDARILAWEASQSAPSLSGDGVSAYRHVFTVDTGTGQVLRFAVAVMVDDASGAVSVPGLDPSVEPVASLDGVSLPDVWAGWEVYSEASGVDSALDAWVRAYTSGESENVRVTMRDEDASHLYPVIVGAESATGRVLQVAAPADGAGDDPDVLLVRAQIDVTWPEPSRSAEDGEVAPSDGGGGVPEVVTAESLTTSFTVDLRMMGARTGAPVVVAWGPVGAGPALVDYGNAFVTADSAKSTGEG